MVKKITVFQNIQGVRVKVLMQSRVGKKVDIVVFLGLSLLKETTTQWNLHRICRLEFAEYCRRQQNVPNIPVLGLIIVRFSHFLFKAYYFIISPLTSTFPFSIYESFLLSFVLLKNLRRI